MNRATRGTGMTRLRLSHFAIAAVALFALTLGALAPPAVLGGRSTEGASLASYAAHGSAPAVALEDGNASPVAAVVPARMVAWASAPGLVSGAAPAPAIVGDAAVLIDEASGVALFEKDPHTRLPPASLTKIMTALVALERGHPDDQVEVNIDSRRMRGSTVMGLVPGECLTLDDLLYGMMLPSGNDAALAIAEHIAGSTDAFVALMNQRAGELGLINTHFTNPHGLDGAAHYSSAFDLAVLTRVAMQRQDFREIVNTTYRVATGTTATYQLGTLNPLYGRLAGVDGVKTGFTRTARQTIVGSVTREGHRVLVVVLRSPDRASDGTALLRWAFEAHAWPARQAAASEAAPVPAA